MEVLHKIRWEDTESAFGDLIKTGVIHNLEHTDLKEFLSDTGIHLKPKVEAYLKANGPLKINTSLKYSIIQPNGDKPGCRYSPTRCHTLEQGCNINEWWEESVTQPVLQEKEIWDHHCNGYETFKIVHLKVHIHLFSPTFDSNASPENVAKIIKFEKFRNKEKIPFVIYAVMKNVPTEEFSNNELQDNGPPLFAYYQKCSFDDSLSGYRSHDYQENCMEWLVNELKKLCKNLSKKFDTSCGLTLTAEQKDQYFKATNCHICDKPFTSNGTRIIDHFRLASRNNNCGCTTSNYRGPAHETCITNYEKGSKIIPVVFRKLSNDMVRYIIKNISSRLNCDINILRDFIPQKEHDVDILPTSLEKYLSFDVDVMEGGKNIKFRFLSFDRLTESLLDDSLLTEFPNIKAVFSDFSNEDVNLLLNENIINPYKFVNSVDSFSKSLETISSSEGISEKERNFTQRIWNKFNIINLNDYTKLYMKRDVLLLTDLCEKFRKGCLDTHHLDPLHYYTLAGFAWDSMMLKSKQELEIVTDNKILSFIQKGIRGGYSHVSKRRCFANNKYMSTYDRDQISKQLMYFDMNNQYGWAMTQCLPYGGFEWDNKWINMDIKESYNDIMNVSDDSPVGYILEVDIAYPQEVHDSHCDLPFCAEKKCPPTLRSKNREKLLATLDDKHHYVIYYRNLKQALQHGLKLIRIHKVLKFKQSPWMKEYIDVNTKQRIQAESKFEKNMFKLLNIIVYGKSLEDHSKYLNTFLIFQKEKAKGMIADANFKSSNIFNENLITMDIHKRKKSMKKAPYLGMVILELSKISILEFHHGYMKKVYSDNISLAYTDTDSLIYELKHHDIYKLIHSDCNMRFDTSEYASNNVFKIPQVNKHKPGIMKDVIKGNVMTDFVGLATKSYGYRFINPDTGELTEKVKGVSKNIKINLKDFDSCLESFMKDMNNNKIKSKYIFGLKPYDDKRYFIPYSYDSLPWGHYKVPDQKNNLSQWFT